ncbi:MAG: DUF3788 domain-containing protein [Bacteroidetes bacterium]|nr:DUF3788 domain-containing protein [Bacteroidota bacterium]
MQSIFTGKSKKPTDADLAAALGTTYPYWNELAEFTRKEYPAATEDWHFTSEKYGWSYRISDKKRVLVYLLPRDRFFKVALVFGQKATDQVMESIVSKSIREELMAAKAYAEGRGIRIDVRDKSNLKDLKELIRIKLAN